VDIQSGPEAMTHTRRW